MKIKGKLLVINMLFLIISIFIAIKSYASDDVTNKLYQDVTINTDGSITVKEAALLSGDYNGRAREIKFKSYDSTKFTGIYSNFAGNTDIYDGSDITNIKIYDISQSNFNTFEDINKIEKEYKKVASASNGKYGVYTLDETSTSADFKIFCPSNKNKVFLMEYTIKDAVVVHNDTAELYWNLIGTNYREDIIDFRTKIHLPGEDNDVRVWSHGPLTGYNKIEDSKTITFNDSNINSYTAETIRVMFDKTLVPNAEKLSNVDGKENILKFEAAMADEANAVREKAKLDQINYVSQRVIELEESPSILRYNWALEEVSELEDSEEKTQFLQRIEKTKEIVEIQWQEDIERDIEWYSKYEYLTRNSLERLQENIEDGFNETKKIEYRNRIKIFEEILSQKEAQTRKNSRKIVTTIYIILGLGILYKITKIIKEKNTYQGKYYREFPGEYGPYVLEYLMKKKITNLSISATILDLIAKKVIRLEEIPNDKKDAKLILIEHNKTLTEAENKLISLLFNIVGKGNTCTLKELTNYGRTENKARTLQNNIEQFKTAAKKEAKEKEYFKKTANQIISYFITSAIYMFSFVMIPEVFKGIKESGNVLKYLILTTAIFIASLYIIGKDKSRTLKGSEEYSKWIAHKRFLKDFSKFDEKTLPEITLWEKYLVTATILGVADKVEKVMKLHIENYTDTNTIANYYLLSSSLNNNLTRTINNSISKSMSTASSTIAASQSSSGGGYGGGSSFGGGGGRTEEAAEVVSKY